MRKVMSLLMWCLMLIGFAGCDDGNVDGECSHEYNTPVYHWRPETEVKLDCAWISQVSDPLRDENNTKCGRTSLVMASACINGYTPEYSEILDLIEWMKEYIPSYAKGKGGSHTYQLEDASKGYYGLDAQSFEYCNGDMVTLKDMYEDLQRGLPVLVGVSSQDTYDPTGVKINPGYRHVELLVGMTPTHVILNDPAASNITFGQNRQYTIESFLTIWDGGVRFLPKRL